MKPIQQFIKEKTQTQNYFDTYSAAVQYALADVEGRGYDYDEDEYFHISTSHKKPGVGKTTSWKLKITDKKGKDYHMIFNAYGMESGKYELNFYTSK